MHSWNGFISFGLVFIPVGLTPVACEESIEFNQIHRDDGGRISQKRICAVCGAELAQEDIVKGYPYEKGKYVCFDTGELERLKATGDKTIRIGQFVRMEEIAPRYFEKAYYVEPSGGAEAFSLLYRAMRQEGRAGLAKVVMGTRDYLVALCAEKDAMTLYRLYYASEIKSAPQVADAPPDSRELQLARIMIGNLSGPFHPEAYRDEFQAKLKHAIQLKIQGLETPTNTEPTAPAAPACLMDALLASIRAQQGAAPGGES